MNIYLSPSEAIEAAERAYAFHLDSQTATLSAAREAAYRALIQHIVENPRELTPKEIAGMRAAMLSNEAHELGVYETGFNYALRLAFTPPTPDVPEKIVRLIEKHKTRLVGSDGAYSEDAVRDLAVLAYEAGMAVSK